MQAIVETTQHRPAGRTPALLSRPPLTSGPSLPRPIAAAFDACGRTDGDRHKPEPAQDH